MPRLCEFYPGIYLTTEEKARKTLIQAKKNLNQIKKNLKVQYTYYQNTHTLENPHKTHKYYKTHTHPHIAKPTHTHTNTYTHTLQNPHIHTPTGVELNSGPSTKP